MSKKFIKAEPYTWISPHYINVFTGGIREIEHLKNVKRGEVSKEFTTSMKKRFLIKIESYPEFKPYLFLTLTYPYDIWDMEKSYYHLKQFVNFFNDEKPLIFWKKEFQIKTKRVHYHLLIGKIKTKINKEFYKKILDYWNKIIYFERTEKQEEFSKASTSCDFVKSDKGAINYLTFYLSKKEEQTVCPDEIEKIGRWWGHFNTKFYKKKPIEKLFIDEHLARLIEKRLHQLKDSPDFDYTKYKYHNNLFFCDKDDKNFIDTLKECL